MSDHAIPFCCREERNPNTLNIRDSKQRYMSTFYDNDQQNVSIECNGIEKVRHKKRRARFVDESGKDRDNDIEKWFIALLTRTKNDESSNIDSTERMSIRLTTCIADIFNLQDSNKNGKSRGWNIVFVLGPMSSAKRAMSISEKLSVSQKGVVSKVARGEALAHVLGISGFANWSLVFECDVTYINQHHMS